MEPRTLEEVVAAREAAHARGDALEFRKLRARERQLREQTGEVALLEVGTEGTVASPGTSVAGDPRVRHYVRNGMSEPAAKALAKADKDGAPAKASPTRGSGRRKKATATRVRESEELEETLGFDPNLHPRDRVGKFTEHLSQMSIGSSVKLPSGVKVSRHEPRPNLSAIPRGWEFRVDLPRRSGDSGGGLLTTSPRMAADHALRHHDRLGKRPKRSGKVLAGFR